MSGRVVGEVKDHSLAKGTTLNVLYALAEAAHHDGITWLPVEPPSGKPDGRCITRTVDGQERCTARSAQRAIRKLEQLGEIEVRKVQRGQRRINVYRITVGRVRAVEIEYDRLPFELDRPFGRPDNLSGRNGVEQSPDGATSVVETTGQDVRSRPDTGVASRPDIRGQDDLTSVAPRAREDGGFEPSEEPSLEPSAADQKQSPGPFVAQVDDRDREPAAAGAEQELVAEIEALPGFDAQSWQALTKVTQHLHHDDVVEALEKLKQRKRVANPMGLLTTLLRVRLEELRREQAELVQAELERRATRSRAEKIAELLDFATVRALPGKERLAFLEAELAAAAQRGEAVTTAEAQQLHALAGDDRRESPRQAFERWIREESPSLEPGQVRADVDAFCDEQGLDHLERGLLQELAEDPLERPRLGAVEEEAA